MATTTTSTESKKSVSVTADYWTSVHFPAPKLRARTIVFAAKKLKPFTLMNVFLSGINVNQYFVPCKEVEISTTGLFTGHESSQVNDNLDKRTTLVNSYDVIQRGEVITCTTGSAVVVSDETKYDKVTATAKRILYVTNVKGNLSGTITGATSLSTATVVAVTNGSRTSNSVGNFYGALVIPALTFDAGLHKILISDDITPNANAATTLADASYLSNGQINAYTRHLNYEEKTTVTVRNNTTETWYTTEYSGGGE